MDFHGVKKAVTHFVTQFTHVSKHFGVYSRKQRKDIWRKMFSKCGLRFKEKCHMCQQNYFKKKEQKLRKIKTKNKKTMKTFKIFGGFRRQN